MIKKYLSEYPDLLKEWDYENNKDICEPDDITVGNSSIKVNWICQSCHHHWKATVYNRTKLKSGCPECAKK